MSVAVANGTDLPKKKNKNAFRRAKKQAEKTLTPSNPAPSKNTTASSTNGNTGQPLAQSADDDAPQRTKQDPAPDEDEDEYEIEQQGFDVAVDDPLFSEYAAILAKFRQPEETAEDGLKVKPEQKGQVFFGDDDNEVPDEEQEQEQQQKLSKKKRKLANKLSVAELKSIVRRPELVEWTDTSAPDPKLLVSLKASRNAVPVPNHWSLKREYLSSKRGIEKTHFALPKFIAETGISEMRDAVLEKENEKSLKQKQRDRVQPKMGKLDIDYQKLYEAFFKHQTKPELTRYGEVYYEGKEYETNLRHLRPGELSDELREALGMPPGAPPPWLINMQRFGPPPSYPSLKIPGLNAPPPPGAQWGFHPGGYGKPPVDEYNRPLFGGDIFGTLQEAPPAPEGAPVERSHWGELQQREDEEEEEEEEEEEGDEGEEDEDDPDRETPAFDRSGLASHAPTELGGAESIGGEFTLRKDGRPGALDGGREGTDGEAAGGPQGKKAYQVLEERGIRNQGFFGGERAYDLAATDRPILGQENFQGRKRKAPSSGDVEVSVDVDELDAGGKGGLSRAEMQKRYEEGRSRDGRWKGKVDQDDLSDMIAEEGRKRIKKDREDAERRRQGRGR